MKMNCNLIETSTMFDELYDIAFDVIELTSYPNGPFAIYYPLGNGKFLEIGTLDCDSANALTDCGYLNGYLIGNPNVGSLFLIRDNETGPFIENPTIVKLGDLI